MARDLRTWLQDMGQRVITEQDSEQDKLHKTLRSSPAG